MKNGVILQTFEWYTEDDGNFYNRLKDDLDNLKNLGINALWLPPSTKGTGTNDVGYGIYDLFDLGEFDQKGTVRTKYGTKEQLLDLVNAAHEKGFEVYSDMVMNHKAGADYVEVFKAVQVAEDNRNWDMSKAHDIEGFTGFNFPGRQGKYSDFVWNFNHFTGVDFDYKTGTHGIFRILGDGKSWADDVSMEQGNFDYLMFADIDHEHPDVRNEFFHWAEWFVNETKVDGFRIDAAKHISANFMLDFVNHVRSKFPDMYMVAEYWSTDKDAKKVYATETDFEIDLFDVQLHFNFLRASIENESYDLRKIFDNSVVKMNPMLAVTFVDNHDSQPDQALTSWVGDWFKHLAYGFILMRKDGYPTIFGGDFYGIKGPHPIEDKRWLIEKILYCRANFAYGEQNDYFNDPHVVGWVRRGDEFHKPSATIISNNGDNQISMFVGLEHKGKTFVDYMGIHPDKVVINDDGFGDFKVYNRNISIWAEEQYHEEHHEEHHEEPPKTKAKKGDPIKAAIENLEKVGNK